MIMYSVIQKFVVDRDLIKQFLLFKQKCNTCKLLKSHVNISHITGAVICQDCVKKYFN